MLSENLLCTTDLRYPCPVPQTQTTSRFYVLHPLRQYAAYCEYSNCPCREDNHIPHNRVAPFVSPLFSHMEYGIDSKLLLFPCECHFQSPPYWSQQKQWKIHAPGVVFLLNPSLQTPPSANDKCCRGKRIILLSKCKSS